MFGARGRDIVSTKLQSLSSLSGLTHESARCCLIESHDHVQENLFTSSYPIVCFSRLQSRSSAPSSLLHRDYRPSLQDIHFFTSILLCFGQNLFLCSCSVLLQLVIRARKATVDLHPLWRFWVPISHSKDAKFFDNASNKISQTPSGRPATRSTANRIDQAQEIANRRGTPQPSPAWATWRSLILPVKVLRLHIIGKLQWLLNTRSLVSWSSWLVVRSVWRRVPTDWSHHETSWMRVWDQDQVSTTDLSQVCESHNRREHNFILLGVCRCNQAVH